MNHPFGWSLPPGVSLSSPGGPNDPERIQQEEAEEKLNDALYHATRCGFTVQDINRIWAEAAEEADFDEGSDLYADQLQQEEMERDAEKVEQTLREREEYEGRDRDA